METSHAFSSNLQVLLKLKYFLIVPNGIGLEDCGPSSNSSFDHCSSGVIFDGDSEVVSLNVSLLYLYGETWFLKKLENLNLSSDHLVSRLPVEKWKLTSSKILSISNNVIAGNFPGEITRGMNQFQVLDIYNFFSGSLPIKSAYLKNLKHFYLGANFFSGMICESYSEIQSFDHFICKW